MRHYGRIVTVTEGPPNLRFMNPYNKFLPRICRWFLTSSALCFVITGSAKIFSVYFSESDSKVFATVDPLLGIQFGPLFLLVGWLEIGVGFLSLTQKVAKWSLIATALVAINIAVYRWGLWLLDYKKPCTCLGTLTDGLQIAPETADTVMQGILIYLVLGSVVLIWSVAKSERQDIASITRAQ